jgi:thiol-disulfide isomerase/thioredoxin
MKKLIIVLLLINYHSFGQNVEVIKFDSLDKIIKEKSDKVQVINFWATWCAPCIKELPYFESLNTAKSVQVNITLISLDFADKLDKVNAFVKRKEITSKVLLLDEIDYNTWIDKVDKSWSGAIPATLIINSTTGKRKFVEKELQEGDLEKLINEVL